MKTIDILKELTSIVGVSGNENDLKITIDNIVNELGTTKIDNMNNLSLTFGDGFHILLDAHIDEIGLIITSITDDGFLKFSKCGGIDERMLLGYEVSVWGKKELKGVISTLPPHLQTADDEKKVPKINDLSIDIGMEKEKAEKYVSIGDRATFKRNFTPLLNNQISASCLDDRSGACAIILAAKKLKDKNCKVTLLFSAQEELGTRGARVGAFNASDIDEAISVDVSFAYSYKQDKDDVGEISKGAMIGVSPVLNKAMTNDLIEVAKVNNIPYQLEIMGGSTSTNADVISITKSGIKTALISIPQKYMHTPIEVVSTKDIEATADLISSYVLKKVGEYNA